MDIYRGYVNGCIGYDDDVVVCDNNGYDDCDDVGDCNINDDIFHCYDYDIVFKFKYWFNKILTIFQASNSLILFF